MGGTESLVGVEADAETFLESAVPGMGPPRCALLKEVVRVGRADENDVRLNDPRVSRRPAEFVSRELHYELRDLDSRNGTLVNGDRVSEPVQVALATSCRLVESIFFSTMAPARSSPTRFGCSGSTIDSSMNERVALNTAWAEATGTASAVTSAVATWEERIGNC